MMRPLDYLKLIASPWAYNDQQPVVSLAVALSRLYGGATCLPAANGRSALYAIFKSLQHALDDEVILQSFTCVAAVNPIIWAGMRPVFADIDPDNLSVSVDAIERRLSRHTRAILVQHTFGMAGPVGPVSDLARARVIPVIEDCAHGLGVSYGDSLLGTRGDLAMLSFGIDKQLSTKAGGAIVVNSAHHEGALRATMAELPALPASETLRWLSYPLLRVGLRHLPRDIATSVGRSLERLGILRRAVAPAELGTGFPPGTPALLSGALAEVILAELGSISTNVEHRSGMTALYSEMLARNTSLQIPAAATGSLLRFPVLCQDRSHRDRARAKLAVAGFDVTTWYDPPVFPRGVDLASINYNPAENPIAEDVASRILTLPTGKNVTAAGVRRIVDIMSEP
jgi:dTDP-4-amino-4,6-dideoxygalactose transaminase